MRLKYEYTYTVKINAVKSNENQETQHKKSLN